MSLQSKALINLLKVWAIQQQRKIEPLAVDNQILKQVQDSFAYFNASLNDLEELLDEDKVKFFFETKINKKEDSSASKE